MSESLENLVGKKFFPRCEWFSKLGYGFVTSS